MTLSEDMLHEEAAFLREEVGRLRRRLSLLTPGLEVFLKRRGFTIYKREPTEDLLIPDQQFLDEYYEMLHKYSFRLFLRDVIKHQDLFTLEQVTRYAAPRVTRGYLDKLCAINMLNRRAGGYSLKKRPIKSFGVTLEWYVAEVFKREFGSEAVWGVKFKRPKVGGDYDVLARFETMLLYCEVKSSPPKQIYDSELAAFLDRVEDLGPEIAVFFMDTELRMKDKIVPLFEAELARRRDPSPPVTRMVREVFHINNRIFIMNAKESIVQNIERAVGWYFRKAASGP